MAIFKRLKRGAECTCNAPHWEKCTCPRDEHYTIKFRDPVTGKQILMAAIGASKKEAEQWEAMELKQRKSEAWREKFLKVRSELVKAPSELKIGQLEHPYLHGDNHLKSSKAARRNWNDLMLVVAWAKNLWRTYDESKPWVRGVNREDRIPDTDKIHQLPVSILNFTLVREYYLAKQREIYGIDRLDWKLEGDHNVSINSTLAKAEDVFSQAARMLLFRDLPIPDMTSFRKHPRLEKPKLDPDPIQAADFAKMLEAVQTAPPQLALVNLIARQTGMRPCSIAELHRDWLQRRNDGWGIDIGKGKTKYTLPITDELAAILQAAEGHVLAGTAAEREKTLAEHTKWLKAVLGIEGRGQGTYKLRKTAACIVRTLYGQDIARDFLGHEDSKSLKHYADVSIEITQAMQHELRAAEKLLGSAKILQMPQQAKAA